MGANSSSFNSYRVISFIAIFVVLLLLRNAVSTDYKSETKSYLRSIGQEDAIDKVIKKTPQVRYFSHVILLHRIAC